MDRLTGFQAKKVISYVESGDEEQDEDEEVFVPAPRSSKTRGRALKRRKTRQVSDEEDFAQNEDDSVAEEVDEGESPYVCTQYIDRLG